MSLAPVCLPFWLVGTAPLCQALFREGHAGHEGHEGQYGTFSCASLSMSLALV
jgi:hypothetical protein